MYVQHNDPNPSSESVNQLFTWEQYNNINNPIIMMVTVYIIKYIISNVHKVISAMNKKQEKYQLHSV